MQISRCWFKKETLNFQAIDSPTSKTISNGIQDSLWAVEDIDAVFHQDLIISCLVYGLQDWWQICLHTYSNWLLPDNAQISNAPPSFKMQLPSGQDELTVAHFLITSNYNNQRREFALNVSLTYYPNPRINLALDRVPTETAYVRTVETTV